MTSPFHPDLRRIAAFLPRRAVGPRSLGLVRRIESASQGAASIMRAFRRSRVDERIETIPLGPSSVRVHHPPVSSSAPHPALLWIHGGGYVMGSAAQDDALCRLVAERLGVLVAAVDYRLAPGHPFPVPLDDCHDALVWLAARRDVDETRVAIGGASAGGGLGAGLALLARDRGDVSPVLQLLSYPMIDDRTALRHDVDERHYRLWNNAANRFGWESYLGTAPGSSSVSGLAVPARHEDLSGLPPAWLGVGTLDLFYDEDLVYADRLRAAGVQCDVELVSGAFHGFDSVRPNASITQEFRSAQIRALARAFRHESAEGATARL